MTEFLHLIIWRLSNGSTGVWGPYTDPAIADGMIAYETQQAANNGLTLTTEQFPIARATPPAGP